jgi:alpha-N-arabinofuranosidase
MDSFIEEVVAIADGVAARKRSNKRIMLSFDEWNVWYRTRRPREARILPGWPVAPPILEEIYNMQDALAFGGAVIALLNHADRVRCACLAQLVNVIGPIMTETGGPAWRQTIFWPFRDFSNFGHGEVLRTRIESDTYDTEYFDPAGMDDEYRTPVKNVPYLKLSAVRGADGGLTLFALNRDLHGPMHLEVEARSFPGLTLLSATTLHDADLKAVNSKAEPDRIVPQTLAGVAINGAHITAELPPASWSVLRFAPA